MQPTPGNFQYVSKKDRKKEDSGSLKGNKSKEKKIPQSTVPFVDTHCHLDMIMDMGKIPWDDFASFKEKEFGNNFLGCVNVCCFTASFEPTEILAEKFDDIYAAYGIHPHDAKYYTDKIEERIIKNMKNPKTVAWGEFGLDFFKNRSPKDVQLEVFQRQLKKALESKKPLIIHTRDAEEDTLRIFNEYLPKDHPVHVHCFTGTNEFAQKLLKQFDQLCLGFTGAITFGKADSLRKVVAQVPLNRLLLETDGPFMAPIPFRGTTAHCGHIPLVGQQVADIHGVSLDQVFEQTTKNADKIYGVFH